MNLIPQLCACGRPSTLMEEQSGVRLCSGCANLLHSIEQRMSKANPKPVPLVLKKERESIFEVPEWKTHDVYRRMNKSVGHRLAVGFQMMKGRA